MFDLQAWVLTAIVLVFGSCVQTGLGFGLAMIAAPVVVTVKPEWVPVVLTASALVLSAINAWNQRAFLQFKDMTVPVLTRVPGTIIGAWLLIVITAFWLQIFVSVCVMLAVVVSVFGKPFAATQTRLGWAAFVSGLMGTTTSIGGPPMALVMQHGKAQTVRANLSLYFTYSCLISLISYGIAGLLSWQLLLESVAFLPCVLLGFLLGIRLRCYVDAGRFRPLLLSLCSMSAIFALGGALMSS